MEIHQRLFEKHLTSSSSAAAAAVVAAASAATSSSPTAAQSLITGDFASTSIASVSSTGATAALVAATAAIPSSSTSVISAAGILPYCSVNNIDTENSLQLVNAFFPSSTDSVHNHYHNCSTTIIPQCTSTTSLEQQHHQHQHQQLRHRHSQQQQHSAFNNINDGSPVTATTSDSPTVLSATDSSVDQYYAKSVKYESNKICSSCADYINEQTLLSVNAQFWHLKCLRCSQCSAQMENQPTCFIKGDCIYCKNCYNRQFGTKCSSCQRIIQPTDWVRRARKFVYHLACFACDHCKRQLSTGEEFALQDCRLLCKQHYVELVEGDSGEPKAKTKRVRTTFAEEQLAVLQTHFQIDSNPDGADLERIATMTGLSKRVTQVWFQNSRARQKKYQGSKKTHRTSNGSGRSSTDPCSSPKSPSCDSNDGMIFPTSVLTSAEDALVPEQTVSAAANILKLKEDLNGNIQSRICEETSQLSRI